MTGRAASVVALLAVCARLSPMAGADELSGADKLRVIWAKQVTWTAAGEPVVNVGLLDGRDEIVIGGDGAGEAGVPRVLPDGEGGAEVRGGTTWRVRLLGGTKAKVAWRVVVASARADEGERLAREAARWRERGYAPRTIEMGVVLGLHGEVIDMRRLVLTVGDEPSPERAREAARVIAKRFAVEAGVHAEVVERPRGTLEARDERGTIVRNEGVLWFAPGIASGTLAVADVPREPSGVERRSYGGLLYATVGADGKLTLANSVAEARLLAGLLPAEIGASAPLEALKAQAVAARNELYAKVSARHPTDPYTLCARSHCQVYAGAGHEDARGQAALAATRGELLVSPAADGERLVDAVYSASCGGHTEDNDRAWGAAPDPALRGTLDAGETAKRALAAFDPVRDAAAFLSLPPALGVLSACAAAPNFRWTAHASAAEVEGRAGVGRVRDLRVLDRGVSGRVVRLAVDGERGSREVKGELEVRRLFGGLKSALFVFTIERDATGFAQGFRFVGGGHGHGVGMCQAGARVMAERGHTYREILDRYYRSTRVKRFY